ncbi:MAG: hypothetical protein ACTHOE_16235 [Conexibacter sp.]
MNHPTQVTPHTVEFDVRLESGEHVGSSVTWALPRAGDHIRLFPDGDPDPRNVLYEVVRAEFEPDNIAVIVRGL